MTQPLSMREFLLAVAAHGVFTREALLAAGHHPKVITAKAEKASRRRYTDYGTVADRPWLIDAGKAYLADACDCGGRQRRDGDGWLVCERCGMSE